MTESEKIKYLNDRINGETEKSPEILYKYRPFDEFTYDMLENSYLYLCPAKNLDDPSECTVSFDMDDYVDIHTEQLTKRCVYTILQTVKPHTADRNYKKIEDFIIQLMKKDGRLNRTWLLEEAFRLQELAPDEDVVSFINQMGSIPDRIDDPEMREQIKNLFLGASRAREEMGICSMTELKDDKTMWEDYANNFAGYCVEFDVSAPLYKNNLFPVVYQDDRQNNILMAIVADFIGKMILGMSHGEREADCSRYVRIFLTKDLKWQHQREWRLLGKAGQKLESPPIKAIYLGKNATAEDRQKMQGFCRKNKITLLQ